MSAEIDRQIDALRTATAALRVLGLEILSAAARSRGLPSIHVAEPGPLAQRAGAYTLCVLDRSTHRAVVVEGCEVVWIDPAPVAGQPPAPFTPLEIA